MSEKNPPVDLETVRGYLSADHKRRYTLIAGALGAVFLLLQMVLPLAATFLLMPGFEGGGTALLRTVDPRRGAFWDGSLWVLAQRFGDGEGGGAILQRIDTDPEARPVEIAAVPLHRPWLLAAWDRLWVVAADGVAETTGRDLRFHRGLEPLGDISPPFLHQGRPAVVEHGPTGLTLLVLEEGGWAPRATMTVSAKDICCPEDNVQVVAAGETLHLFLRFGDSLYHRVGFPETVGERREDWEVVTPSAGQWHAALVGGRPSAFVRLGDGPQGRIRGWQRQNGAWEPFFDYRGRMITAMGVLAPAHEGLFYLLLEPFPGALRLLRVEDRAVTGELRFGQRSPFAGALVGVALIPHGLTLLTPLALVLVLGRLMPRYRVCRHTDGTRLVPYAPLFRRGLAQVVDTVLVAAPAVAAFAPLFTDFENLFAGPDGPMGVLRTMGWVMLWMLCGLVLASLLEGRWGVTPGKWALGIRVVGTDLAPCGFGRALVRNLLKVVDGFFNFLVGILCAALSANWQRLGDMAAHTVVVDVRPR